MRKLAPMRTPPMTPRAIIDHQTVIGMVECLDGSMTPREIAEVFDQANARRDADERCFLLDRHVRRFLVNLLRERNKRRVAHAR